MVVEAAGGVLSEGTGSISNGPSKEGVSTGGRTGWSDDIHRLGIGAWAELWKIQTTHSRAASVPVRAVLGIQIVFILPRSRDVLKPDHR